MGQAEVYLDVEAQAVRANAMGVEFLNDGPSGGGQTDVATWITWTEEGHTGIGWFWDDANNYLKTGWEKLVDSGYTFECGVKHTKDEESFKQHVQYDHAENLNAVLGDWNNDAKLAFLKSHTDVFVSCTV